MPRRDLFIALAVALAAALATTWPMAAHPATTVLGLPAVEAVDHLWSLYAGLRDGPLVIRTDLVDHPDGYTWVLGDPLNLIWYAPGEWIGGPALGFNLVHLGNLLLGALAAVAAGREMLPGVPARPWFAALVAVTLAPMAGGLFAGMTEAQTMGWTVLALVAARRAARAPSWRIAVLAGLLGGATAWAGPYPLLYLALALPFAVVGPIARARRFPLPLAAAGLLAALLALPVVHAIHGRAAGLPGTIGIAGLVIAEPLLDKNRMLGADLAGLVLPLPFAAGIHAVYLGTACVLLAIAGAWRRGAAPLAAIALVMAVLSMGTYLQFLGTVPLAGGRALVLPAGWMSLAVDALGRAPRWYRASMVAGILLAPLAAAGAERIARGRTWAVAVLAIAVAADALWLSPLPWPREVFPARPPAAFAALDEPGPIIEVPPRSPGPAPGGTGTAVIRNRALLWQTFHGRPLGHNPHAPASRTEARQPVGLAAKVAERALEGNGPAARVALERLGELGFTWVVHLPHPAEARLPWALRAALGPARVDTADLLAWRTGAEDPGGLGEPSGGGSR